MTIVFLTTDATIYEHRIADPTLWGIYSSNIAQRSWNHLLSNLGGLLVIGGGEYVLLTAIGYRKHYVGVFIGSFLLLPLFGHLFLQFVLVNQPVFQSYEAVAFSGPLAAMVGYLPLVIATYLSENQDLSWPLFMALLLYSGGLGWAMSQIFGFDVATIIVSTLGIAGIGLIAWNVVKKSENKDEQINFMFIVLFLLTLFFGGLHGLFPGNHIGSMVGHLAGFLPGFFVPMIVLWAFSVRRPDHDLAIGLD